MSLYFIEVQPRIQAAHVFLCGNFTAISFTCNSVTQTEGGAKEKGKSVICSWDSPKLILSESPIIKVLPQATLCMRFKTSRNFEAEETLSNLFSDNQGELQPAVVLRCGFCNIPITKCNNVFKRVLHLPSEMWYEFSGRAFCHGDSHTSSQLLPRAGDLLIGESVFLLDGNSLSSDSLTVRRTESEAESEHQIVCKRCHSVCGSTLTSTGRVASNSTLSEVTIRLQKTKVSTTANIENKSYSQSLYSKSDYFARKLYSFSKSRMAFLFKIRDQTGKVYLSVWLMNTVSRVIHNHHESTKEVKKTLQKFSGYHSDVFIGLPSDVFVLRVMFKSHMVAISEASVEVDTDVIELDTRECLELLLLLSHSNLILPPSQRTVSGYKVGLLSIRLAQRLSVHSNH